MCSDHGRPRPSPAGWIPGPPPPSYLCHLPPISTFLIRRCKYLTSKNPLQLKILRGNDRWDIGRHTWACLDEVRSPGASGMTRLVGSPRPRPGFAVIRAHTPVGERATPFFEIAVNRCQVSSTANPVSSTGVRPAGQVGIRLVQPVSGQGTGRSGQFNQPVGSVEPTGQVSWPGRSAGFGYTGHCPEYDARG